MNRSLLDQLLFDDEAPADVDRFRLTPAKAANSANSPMTEVGKPTCEALRKVANGDDADSQESQKFAAVRSGDGEPPTGLQAGNSQDSQDSQGCPRPCPTASAADISAVAWTAADIQAFVDRRARLLRWGWTEDTADALAERLVLRDREHDERVSCADCEHYRPGRCGNHQRAGLNVPAIGRDLVALLQRCPGFK